MNIEQNAQSETGSVMILAGIVVLGMALRLNGIDWGLPNALHPDYSYHPDEWISLYLADLLAGEQMRPKHFLYGGTFYFFTVQLMQDAGSLITDLWGGLEVRNTILFGRGLGVLYGLLTIIVTYLTGCTLFNRRVGLLAALLIALYPGQVFWAQRIRPDELFAFLFALNCLVMACIYKGRGCIYRNAVIGGLMLGLAVATRFPAIALYPGYAVAIFLPAFQGKPAWKPLLASGPHWLLIGFTLVGYVVASPYSLMYPSLLIDGMQMQFSFQSNPFADAIGRGPGWYQYGGRMFAQALGYPLYGLALAGVALAVWKRRREDVLLFAMSVPYFVALSLTSWVVVRYTLPLLPVLSLWSARLVVSLAAGKTRRAVLAGAIGMAMLLALVSDMAYANAIRGEDARDTAEKWIIQNVRSGASIGAFIDYEGDKFKNPPAEEMHRWAYFSLRQDGLDAFFNDRFDYLVINDRFIREGKRLGDRHPYPSFTHLQRWMKNHPGYELVARFSRDVRFAGMDFGYQFTSVDYMLARPTIYVFRRLS